MRLSGPARSKARHSRLPASVDVLNGILVHTTPNASPAAHQDLTHGCSLGLHGVTRFVVHGPGLNESRSVLEGVNPDALQIFQIRPSRS